MEINYPVFGICGYSGSGKTTLIESILENLTQKELKIAIIKHDAHGLKIDKEGKDSDRFFKKGADVIIQGPEQTFYRAHKQNDIPLHDLIKKVGPYYDLIIVEGHKTTPLKQKIWLCGEDGEGPPQEAGNIKRILGRDENRPEIVIKMINDWLPEAWRSTPLLAGILVGGKSSRFGQSKHLILDNKKTWLEKTIEKVKPYVDGIAILGSAELPQSVKSIPMLCDVEHIKGPLAGMLAATRWKPFCSWLFLPCDLPLLEEESIQWLLEHRKPGVWAILPRLTEAPNPEPLAAYYDLRSASLLERAARPMDLKLEPKVITPSIPKELHPSWKNVNTQEDLPDRFR